MTRREIIVADWADNYKALSGVALATMVVMFGVAWFKPDAVDPEKALMISSILSAPLIAWRCFDKARLPDGLKGLLGPVTRDQVVVTKFVSALSMALFTVNIPGLMLLEPRFLFQLNAVILFLTSICVGGKVTDGFPEADFVLILGLTFVSSEGLWILKTAADWILSHLMFTSIGALCTVPIIVIVSVVHRDPII